MATITTKYEIGDQVYLASTTTVAKRHPCPDCLGKKEWMATSPAGGEYVFPCPRCSARYNANDDLRLEYSEFAASVVPLTIGSIQYNSAAGSWDSGARYMCRETGIDSGSVYDEARLFPTEEEALAAAHALAAEQNKTTPWVVQQYNKTRSVCDYQLSSAELKTAREAVSRSRSMVWGINDLFSTIEEADDKDAIIEAIEDYKRFQWESDKKEADDEMKREGITP